MGTSELHNGSSLIVRAKPSEKKAYERLTTGSKNIDDLLGGGLEAGAITQFYGGPGIGKTHLCHLLCAVLPTVYNAIYIDTEGKFREEKIQTMAKAKGSQWENIHNIQVESPLDTKGQESYIDQLCSSMDLTTVKLIIIDSMTYHYKTEYAERSRFAKRAERLDIYMRKIRQLAIRNKIAVVITNHSTSDPHNESRSRPFGGNIMSHASDYIINLTQGSKMPGSIKAVLVKNPVRRPTWLPLQIADYGFFDEPRYYIGKTSSDDDGNGNTHSYESHPVDASRIIKRLFE